MRVRSPTRATSTSVLAWTAGQRTWPPSTDRPVIRASCCRPPPVSRPPPVGRGAPWLGSPARGDLRRAAAGCSRAPGPWASHVNDDGDRAVVDQADLHVGAKGASFHAGTERPEGGGDGVHQRFG